MSKISGRINQIEREIAARVRRVRKDAWLSQPQFAAALGETPTRMSNIEYARTPLTIAVADKIAEKFKINVIWLATGEGKPRPYVGKIRKINPKLHEKAPLSRAFNDSVKQTLIDNHHKGIAIMIERLGTTWDAMPIKKQYELSESQIRTFSAKLDHFFSGLSIISRSGLLAMLEATLNEYKSDWDEEQPSDKNRELRKRMLTLSATSAKNVPVQNQWYRLKQRIQRVTESPGGKSALAKFLGVDLTQLSKWLTDSKKSAREPGADYTLKMLQWVQERESQ